MYENSNLWHSIIDTSKSDIQTIQLSLFVGLLSLKFTFSFLFIKINIGLGLHILHFF